MSEDRARHYIAAAYKRIIAQNGSTSDLPSVPTSARCPLCGTEMDNWAHPILRCRHPLLQNMRIAEHNKELAEVVHAIARGSLGKWHFTADLPGWRMGQTDAGPPPKQSDKYLEATLDAATAALEKMVEKPDLEPDSTEPTWEELNTLPGNAEAEICESESVEEFSLANASDSESDTESEYDSDASAEDEADTDSVPLAGEGKQPPPSRQHTLLDSWKLDPQEVFASSPDGDKRIGLRELRNVLAAGGSLSGLPAWLGWLGRGRPDAVVLQGCLRGKAKRAPLSAQEKSKIKVHLIEFTRTSEAYWLESEKAKVLQHKDVVAALTAAGYKCKLHIIQVGVRGGIRSDFRDRLKTLGLSREQILGLSTKLSVSSAVAGVKAWWTRRAVCASGGQRSKHKNAWLAPSMPGCQTVRPFNALATLRKAETRASALERETRARKGTD